MKQLQVVSSSNTDIIQSDAVGLKGVRSFDFEQVKQIGNQVHLLIRAMLQEVQLMVKVYKLLVHYQ